MLKVFHAARQDVEIFFHLTGKVPTPLFDTQVAAMVCGFGEQVELRNLAAQLAGRAHRQELPLHRLGRRPLTERQLRLCSPT